MLELTDLPTVNAILNGTATGLLTSGFVSIRRGRREGHRRAMIGALCCSALFLLSYLVYHAQVGSVRYAGEGPLRTLYLGILLTHTVLAACLPFLVVVTVFRAVRERFASHRAIARWTLPIWLYVSVTGVVIYLMLYHGPGRP